MADQSALEIYQRADKKWAWRLKATNGFIVATDGGQGYEKKDTCKQLGEAVRDGAYKSAPTKEV